MAAGAYLASSAGENLADLVEHPLEACVGHQRVQLLEHTARQLADPTHQLGAGHGRAARHGQGLGPLPSGTGDTIELSQNDGR